MENNLQKKIEAINMLAEASKTTFIADKPVEKVTDSLSRLITTPRDAYLFMAELDIAARVAEMDNNGFRKSP